MHRNKTIVPIFIFFALTFLNRVQVSGQKVVIVMRDSSKVISRLTAFSDHHLHSYNGIYKLSKIYSVRFEAKDAKKAEFFNEKLLSSGVTVFIGSNRLNPTGTAESELPTTEVKGSPLSNNPNQEDRAVTSIGLGLGLDYGGIGVRISYLPADLVDVFIAGGYALAGIGFNGGLVFNLRPGKLFVPTITPMYGYNAAFYGSPNGITDKFFYGPSLGLGFKVKPKRKPENAFQLEVIIPFRTKEYDQYVAGSSPSTLPGSVLFSIGYHFGFQKSN